MFIFALFTLVLSQNESFVIQSPQELAKNAELEQIPFIITEYSYVPYGESISGVLEVANPYNFCTPKFNRSVDRSSDPSNVKILLLSRGGCTFTKKTINAQLFGYQIVVIVDDREEKISHIVMTGNDYETQEINITTLMISKKQGDLIKQYMDVNDNDKENVQIVVKFPDIPKTDIVSYHYYFWNNVQRAIVILIAVLPISDGNESNIDLSFMRILKLFERKRRLFVWRQVLSI